MCRWGCEHRSVSTGVGAELRLADEPKFPSRQLGRVGFFDTNDFTKEGVEQVEISSGLLCGGNNAVFVEFLVL